MLISGSLRVYEADATLIIGIAGFTGLWHHGQSASRPDKV